MPTSKANENNRSKWNAIYQRSERPTEYDTFLFEAISSRLNPGQRVLELACGCGALAQALAQEGYKVTAVDFSEKALQHVEPHQNLQLELIDLDEAFPKGRFHAVVARRFFDAALVGSMKAAVTAKGWLIIKTFDTRILEEKPAFNSDWILRSELFEDARWRVQWHEYPAPSRESVVLMQRQ